MKSTRNVSNTCLESTFKALQCFRIAFWMKLKQFINVWDVLNLVLIESCPQGPNWRRRSGSFCWRNGFNFWVNWVISWSRSFIHSIHSNSPLYSWKCFLDLRKADDSWAFVAAPKHPDNQCFWPNDKQANQNQTCTWKTQCIYLLHCKSFKWSSHLLDPSSLMQWST